MTTKTTEKSRVAPVPAIRTWRERISVGPDFPLHAPTDVERAMEAEIAELRTLIALRVIQPAGYKLMPKQLTKEMEAACLAAAREYREETGGTSFHVIYEAAIEAAPAVQEVPARFAALGNCRRCEARGTYAGLVDKQVVNVTCRDCGGTGKTVTFIQAQQAVAPADVLAVPRAIMDIKAAQFQSDEYKRGHRDARHAAADLVLEMADKLVALATPTVEQKGGVA